MLLMHPVVGRRTTLDEAFAAYERGWCVIPIVQGTKKAALRTWQEYQQKRPSREQVYAWFHKGDRGLAVILGPVSGGLACRDFDSMDSYQRWAEDHPELAATLPTVETGQGRHVYFKLSGGVPAKWKDKTAPLLGDGELRLTSCYCVLPPSVHPDGKRYKWLIPPAAEIPSVELGASGLDLCYMDVAPDAEPIIAIPAPQEGQCLTDSQPSQTSQDSQPFRLVDSQDSQPSQDLQTFSVVDFQDVIKSDEKKIRLAIERTLPTGPGQRRRHLFDLARELKAIPHLANAPVGELLPIVERWHEAALPSIRTKDWGETWDDFTDQWPNVRWGANHMERVLDRAKSNPPPQVAGQYGGEGRRLLVALCRELQRDSGNKPFFLSGRKAAELIKTDQRSASRWLERMERDGILKCESKGTLEGKKASAYRYLGD